MTAIYESPPMESTPTESSLLAVPRSRGAMSGLLLVLLGAWGALIPFFGPYFNFGFAPDQSWTWTAARGWLEVLPGAVTALGGLLLLISRNRAIAILGGWLAVAGGAWFIVGNSLAALLHIGSIGAPIDTRTGVQSLEWLALFYALGGLIILLAAGAIGRLSVRSVRDVRWAQRRAARQQVPVSARQEVPASARQEVPVVAEQPTTVNERQPYVNERAAADEDTSLT